MDTKSTTCNRISPPGEKIIQDYVKVKKLYSDPNGHYPTKITFTQKGTTTPLQPLVQAKYNKKTDCVDICAIVFIDADYNPQPFSVYQEYVKNPKSENPQIKFYITYNLQETETANYDAYRISFPYPHGEIPPKDLNTIETFLLNIDPVISRGTTTTVE